MRRSHLALAPALAVLVLSATPARVEARPKSAVIVVHDALATPEGAVVRGQVVADKGFQVADPAGVTGRFATVKKVFHNLQLLRGEPVRHAAVVLTIDGARHAVTADRNGWFTLQLGPDSRLALGEHEIRAELAPGQIPGRSLDARLVVIPANRGRVAVSDVDDTVIKSEATSLVASVRRVLTTDAGDLEPVPQAAETYRDVRAAGVPIVFVSAGSAKMYPKLRTFFRTHGFPRAPILLNEGPFLTGDLRGYKGRRVGDVERQLPRHQLVLIGDSGQKDPEAYADLQRTTPSRVRDVLIHLVTDEDPGSKRFDGQHAFRSYGPDISRRIIGTRRGRTAGRSARGGRSARR